jgi:hypothetical protein
MAARAVLLEECKNVEALLDGTLRHEYGLDGSQDFYNECFTRLKFIQQQLSNSAETDLNSLSKWGGELNELSRLICRIERSSLGEYSWPFVEELKKMASAICIQASASEESSKIYVLADGGLDAYRIFPEPKRPSHRQRLLLTIVFPKTLKHLVLFHSILGHELGHAIWRCSKHEQTLKNDAWTKFSGVPGVFADPAATLAHIYAAQAPAEVQTRLGLMENALGINQGNFWNWASWQLWVEEILCDFIGLATFGPSFVGAQCSLLPSINPHVYGFGKGHPASAWRINLILRGAKLLGYDVLPPEGHPARPSVEVFWKAMNSVRSADPWYDVLSDAQLLAALTGVTSLLQKYPPSGYTHPDFDLVWDLLSKVQRGIPPTSSCLKDDGKPSMSKCDFRHILYAGWIASVQTGATDFGDLNRLCEHGIMQQRAIDIQLQG